MKEYFLVGFSILITAIIFNFLLAKMGLATWYDILTLKNISKKYISFITLVLIYPYLLGYVAIKTLSYLK